MIKELWDRILKSRNPSKFWRIKGAKIGNNCSIDSTASLGSEPYLIQIGDHTRVNSGVNLITHDGGVWVLRHLNYELRDIDLFGKITIDENVHIGTNAVIMPGVHIGKNCIVGCCAVVTKDVPENSIVAGVPARVISSIEEYKNKHVDDFEHIKYFEVDKKKEYLVKKYMKP